MKCEFKFNITLNNIVNNKMRIKVENIVEILSGVEYIFAISICLNYHINYIIIMQYENILEYRKNPLKYIKKPGRFKMGDWSSGMIPALGAGGRGFDSPITPFFLFNLVNFYGI